MSFVRAATAICSILSLRNLGSGVIYSGGFVNIIGACPTAKFVICRCGRLIPPFDFCVQVQSYLLQPSKEGEKTYGVGSITQQTFKFAQISSGKVGTKVTPFWKVRATPLRVCLTFFSFMRYQTG